MRSFRLAFAAVMALGAVPTSLAPATPPAEPDARAVLVTVAEVRDDRATVWVRAEGGGDVRLRYRVLDGAAEARETRLVPDPERDHSAHVSLERLAPRTRYGYEVSRDGDLVAGTFVTAPSPDEDVPVRLLWSGDLGGRGHCRDAEDGYPIFHAMRRRHADAFLFVGDTMYADQLCGPGRPAASFVAATLPDFHAKHRGNRADHAIQRFFRTTPVYAIWDDHEVRNNFAGPHEPLMTVGRQAFRDYWAIDGPAEEPNRLYRRVRWGRHADVFILDTRQYRSANGAADGPGKSMLGGVQRAWLLDGLATSDATWKLVVTSVPLGMFTGGASSDSWSSTNMLGFPRRGIGFVHERDAILSAIREQGIRNVVFVSGDVHHAEILRHEPTSGHVLHEVVAGPLSARQGFPRFLDRSLGSRSLASLGWTKNFGELEPDGESLTVRILDTAGTVRVSLRIPVMETRPMTARRQAESDRLGANTLARATTTSER